MRFFRYPILHINTSTDSVTTTVTVGKDPVHAVVTPDASSVYVVNAGSNSVSVLSTSANSVAAAIAVGKNPVWVAISPDDTKDYVTNGGSDTVSVINTATNMATATVPVRTRFL
jgi:YVTN family beta-propeller protein